MFRLTACHEFKKKRVLRVHRSGQAKGPRIHITPHIPSTQLSFRTSHHSSFSIPLCAQRQSRHQELRKPTHRTHGLQQRESNSTLKYSSPLFNTEHTQICRRNGTQTDASVACPCQGSLVWAPRPVMQVSMSLEAW